MTPAFRDMYVLHVCYTYDLSGHNVQLNWSAIISIIENMSRVAEVLDIDYSIPQQPSMAKDGIIHIVYTGMQTRCLLKTSHPSS